MKPVNNMSVGELAAYVCSHLKFNDIHVVLSGGSCVTLYANGKYVSYALDFIENMATAKRRLTRILKEIGFEPEGRHYRHPDAQYLLEFPSRPLAIGSEPPGKVDGLSFMTGELRILSPTDCIKDRLAAFYHWNDRQCFEQALLVFHAHQENINFNEIERWSIAEGHPEKFQEFLASAKD